MQSVLAKPGTTQRYGVHWLGTTRPLANARVLCDQEETASAALAAVTQASREVSTAGARLQRLMLTDVQNQLATVQLQPCHVCYCRAYLLQQRYIHVQILR